MVRDEEPLRYISDKTFTALEDALGSPLQGAARDLLEEGIVRAIVHREAKTIRRDQENTPCIFDEIRHHANALEQALAKALMTAHVPLWVLYLGADREELPKIIDAGPSRYMAHLAHGVQMVGRGAARASEFAAPLSAGSPTL